MLTLTLKNKRIRILFLVSTWCVYLVVKFIYVRYATHNTFASIEGSVLSKKTLSSASERFTAHIRYNFTTSSPPSLSNDGRLPAFTTFQVQATASHLELVKSYYKSSNYVINLLYVFFPSSFGAIRNIKFDDFITAYVISFWISKELFGSNDWY